MALMSEPPSTDNIRVQSDKTLVILLYSSFEHSRKSPVVDGTKVVTNDIVKV